MIEAQNRTEIEALLRRHGLSPRHALGQHFLADPNIVGRIVRTSGVGPGDDVVEIGPGTGTLTKVLAATGANVVAYEIDHGLESLLAEELAGLDIDVRFANALDLDFAEALDGDGWHLVANLPYNVGTPLLLNVLRHQPTIAKMTVMLQAEVVARLVAAPGSADYGIPSVVTQLNARPVTSFRVAPQVFVPPPAVDSEVIVLERIPADPLAERAIEIAQAAFSQRRKMLRRSLGDYFGNVRSVLAEAGIDETRRAETVTPEEFLRLAVVS